MKIRTAFNLFVAAASMVIAVTNTAQAAHPNWEFPFVRGLNIALDGLARNTADHVNDPDFWEHHVKVRHNMALAMANQIQANLHTIRDPQVYNELNRVIAALRNSPSNIGYWEQWSVGSWVDVAERQQFALQRVFDELEFFADNMPQSPDNVEYPFLVGLTVAGEGLVHANARAIGDADLWKHHFDLRMNAAYGMADRLEAVVTNLPPEYTAFMNEVKVVADEIRNFYNPTRTGDVYYWSQEADRQQRMFERVRAHIYRLRDIAHNDACVAALLP